MHPAALHPPLSNGAPTEGGCQWASYLDEQLASSQDEARVSVAHAAGELPEGSSIAGVRICAEEHLPCQARHHVINSLVVSKIVSRQQFMSCMA